MINPDSRFSIGLNVDRDHVTLVVLDFVGKVRGRASREIHFAKPEAVRAFFRRSVGQLARQGRHQPGIAWSGSASRFPDDIARAHLPDQPADYAAWASVRIEDLIRDVLAIPVFIENDAAAAAIGEMQFGSGHRYRSFFYLLVTAALGGGLVADGSYIRGATGRSGEIGWLRARNEAGESHQLQNIVSLSCLYSRLAERGFRVATPRGLMRLEPAARSIVDRWISESTEALVESFLAINCLINPQAILIGGPPARGARRPIGEGAQRSLERPCHRRCRRSHRYRAPLTADDAPAVGAAILPFSYRLLPTRFALLKAP